MSGNFDWASFDGSIGGFDVDPLVRGHGGLDIFKPTGLVDRPRKKEARKDVEDRVEETREIHAEVAGQLARELAEDHDVIPSMVLSDIDREIGMLLRKAQRTEDDEILLLMLMAVV